MNTGGDWQSHGGSGSGSGSWQGGNPPTGPQPGYPHEPDPQEGASGGSPWGQQGSQPGGQGPDPGAGGSQWTQPPGPPWGQQPNQPGPQQPGPPPGGQWGPPPGQPPGQPPAGPYGQQGGPWGGQEQTEVLGSYYGPPGPPPAPPRRGRGRWFAVLGSAVALVLVAVAAVYAVNRLSGDGAQPESVIPADAVALVKVDLDPPAGQKIAVARFLRKFEPLKERIDEGDDLRKTIWDAMAEDSEELEGLSYEDDVEPWIGDRAAVAVLPGEDEAVGVLQVKDEGKAEEGLRKILEQTEADSEDKTGLVIRDGYAIFAKDQASADKFSEAAEKESLESSANFKNDMEALGDRGVAAIWSDTEAAFNLATEASGEAMPPEASLFMDQIGSLGRQAWVLRFDEGYVEIEGKAFGVELLKNAPTENVDGPLTRLPESTAFAYSLDHGDAYVQAFWDVAMKFAAAGDAEQAIDQIEARYGITLPDDLKTALGTSLVLTLDREGLDQLERGGLPEAGMRVTTDGEKAEELVGRVEEILADEGATFDIATQQTDDGIAVALTDSYAEKLAGDGGLGQSERFKKALPSAGSADFAMWVDIGAFVEAFGDEMDSEDPATQEALSKLTALGATVDIKGNGEADFQMRLLAE